MLKIYKPTKTNKGSMVSFFLTNDNSIMVQLVKQASWDGNKNQGSFFENYKNDNAKIVSKLGRSEVAGLLDSMERNTEFNFQHNHGKSPYKLVGFFQPHFKSIKNSDGEWVKTDEQIGYSLSITKIKKEDESKLTVRIGFNYSEARLLKNDLEMMLGRTFVENAFDGKKEDTSTDSNAPKEKVAKAVTAGGGEEQDEEEELW